MQENGFGGVRESTPDKYREKFFGAQQKKAKAQQVPVQVKNMSPNVRVVGGSPSIVTRPSGDYVAEKIERDFEKRLVMYKTALVRLDPLRRLDRFSPQYPTLIHTTEYLLPFSAPQESTGLCGRSHGGALPLKPELFEPDPVEGKVAAIRRLLGVDKVVPKSEDSQETEKIEHCRAIAVGGSGGVGKSELAAYLVSNEEILRHFHTQVFWISLGNIDTATLLAKMEELQGSPAPRCQLRALGTSSQDDSDDETDQSSTAFPHAAAAGALQEASTRGDRATFTAPPHVVAAGTTLRGILSKLQSPFLLVR